MTHLEVSRTSASQQRMLGGGSGAWGPAPDGPAVPVCGLATLTHVPSPLESTQNSVWPVSLVLLKHRVPACHLGNGKLDGLLCRLPL